MRFTEVARKAGDLTFAERCRMEAAQVRLKIEQNGWDGEWYRRAYFDDGTPLGSASNAECRIDSIAQRLVGSLRGRRYRAISHGDGRGGSAPRSPGPCVDPALTRRSTSRI